MTFVFKDFFAEDGDFGFDFLDDFAAGIKGHLAVLGTDENEEADFASFDDTEAVVNVHAAQGVFGECSLTDFVEGFVGHFGIGAVVDGDDLFTIDFIRPHLPEEDVVGADVGLGLVLGDAVADEGTADRAFDEDLFVFMFFCFHLFSMRN